MNARPGLLLALALTTAMSGCRNHDMQPTLGRLGELYDGARFELEESVERAEVGLDRFASTCEQACARTVHHVGRAMEELGRAIRALGDAADELNAALADDREPPPPISP